MALALKRAERRRVAEDGVVCEARDEREGMRRGLGGVFSLPALPAGSSSETTGVREKETTGTAGASLASCSSDESSGLVGDGSSSCADERAKTRKSP